MHQYLKNKIWLIILFISNFVFSTKAQTILSEDFASSIPSNWTQNTTTGITWAHTSSFGSSGAGCAIANHSSSSSAGNGWLQASAVNISSISSPYISFNVGLVGVSTPPNISLWYSTGGSWTSLASWGAGAGATPITQTTNPTPTLNAGNITWVNVNYDLSALASNTNIRFSFGADFTNAGWVLIDSVRIYSASASTVNLPYKQDFEASSFLPAGWQRFGSNTNADWQRSNTIGGYSNSAASAYFDNFNTNVNGSFYGMRTVWLNFSGTAKPRLTFDYAYAKRTVTQSDRLGIWYLTPGGNWTNLIVYSDATLTTASDKSAFFVPTANEWKTQSIDLSQFIGQNSVRFAFECNSRNGNAVYVDNVHFFDAATDVSDINSPERLSLYPNPVSGDNLYISKGEVKHVSVIDIAGKEMHVPYSLSKNSTVINTHALPNGLYILKLQTATENTSYRFSVNK